ncbi:MAG: CRISPR system precrRNA processing endoribonuclease RAMP protein Cas6 [Nitrospinae bacterium]|nr:CRISPR system precrRNA processing endoribonuclease RAMP protein Cas6 [Nitrospinota bacterium]
MIQSLSIAEFLLTIQAEETLILPPYKGSTFRGGFGHAFKKVICVVRNKDCSDCILKEKCIYSFVFETSPPSNTTRMRKYISVPHPFVIIPPMDRKREYKEGEELTFKLTLIGKAIDYLPYFIYTFEELSRIGIGKGKKRFRLLRVRNRDSEGKEITIYDNTDNILKNSYQTITIQRLLQNTFPDKLHIKFHTPTRIVYNQKLIMDLEFHILIRNLIRRISNLSYFHCNGDPSEFDFKGIIKRAEDIKTKNRDLFWYDWERFSGRQETKMKLGGFVGDIVFEGDIEEFKPYILLDEFIHVGKGTTFGLGEYKIAN